MYVSHGEFYGAGSDGSNTEKFKSRNKKPKNIRIQDIKGLEEKLKHNISLDNITHDISDDENSIVSAAGVQKLKKEIEDVDTKLETTINSVATITNSLGDIISKTETKFKNTVSKSFLYTKIKGFLTQQDISEFVTRDELNEVLKSKLDTKQFNDDYTNDKTITRLGNNVNGPDGLVQLDKDGKLPNVDGSQITHVSVNIDNSGSSVFDIVGDGKPPYSKDMINGTTYLSRNSGEIFIYVFDRWIGQKGTVVTDPNDLVTCKQEAIIEMHKEFNKTRVAYIKLLEAYIVVSKDEIDTLIKKYRG
jgi:hypothetical protein